MFILFSSPKEQVNPKLPVGFYDPKSRVPVRGDHAARARACQDEGAPSRERQKSGTGVPCHVARSCHVARGGRPTCCFRRLSTWRLGFVQGVFSPGG